LPVIAFLATSNAVAEDRDVTLAKGTAIDIVFVDSLSSGTASVGDAFQARMARALYVDGRLVLVAGTAIEGEVQAVESLRDGAKSGYVGVRFVSIVLPADRTATKMAATLSGIPQAGADDLPPIEEEARFPVVLIAAARPNDGPGALVLDRSGADDYAQTRLSESEVDVVAGTLLSMQLDKALTLPARAMAASARAEARRARQASSMDVAALQRALTERGLYSGLADGELGDSTRLGILRLQIESKRPATGELDAGTLALLGLPSAVATR
jgi:hypothetical protein